ncbi:MAG: hypothetical protein O2780_06470 [Proteobacteria bacterium]|jgi:hypothetical protein|nr:hypothetical protein [Pseudomonadota bacterium]MDA1301877.1 hypothetical protein [Pseudomonadota bacterium]
MFLASLTRKQQQVCYCLAHSVVVSDGELTAGEEQMMAEMRREMALPTRFEPHYVAAEGHRALFDTGRSRAIVLIALIRLAYADGAFEIEEQCYIHDLATEFDLSGDQFSMIDNWVRRLLALQEEARSLIAPR